MTLFNNINRNEHSLNFYYVIKLSHALTFKLAHGETSKIVVDKKHIKNKIYLNDLKKNYYKPHFIIIVVKTTIIKMTSPSKSSY